jgi:CxxC motif-containing protein (DUF1111 family)
MKARTSIALYLAASSLALVVVHTQERPDVTAQEAPAAFDNLTNGFVTQEAFDEGRDDFEERELIDDGLGPTYNAQGCAECHQNPVTGAISQITELRAGHHGAGFFEEHPGGSLIHSRAIDAAIQERVLPGNEVRTFRSSLNTLGDGFVECIDDQTLVNIAGGQPGHMRGQVILVPVLEDPGNRRRVGRFGWKNQHASLISFSADAYLNEMGITNPFLPGENSSNGYPVVDFDTVEDPEDDGEGVELFARFMRATKAPPRDTALAATADARQGGEIFEEIGCATCHVPTIRTAPPGTVINAGHFVVPPALGNKTIHPFSDFLLHDVGTGDGIVQNGPQSTRNKLRTAPLWGLRTHNRFMHDAESLTLAAAIMRHAGEASGVTRRYRDLPDGLKVKLLLFLLSL